MRTTKTVAPSMKTPIIRHIPANSSNKGRVKAKRFFQIAASRDHEEAIVMLEENYFEWKKVLR